MFGLRCHRAFRLTAARAFAFAVTAFALGACQPAAPISQATGADTPAPTLDPALLALLAPPPSPSAALPLSPRAAEYLADGLKLQEYQARMDPDLPTHFKVAAGTFLLVAGDAGAVGLLDASAALTEKVVGALYAGPLQHRPEGPVTVWLYTSRATAAAGMAHHIMGGKDLDSHGVYDDAERAIVTRLDAAGLGSLAHEIAHPLVSADAPRAPVYLSEGIPALLETAVFSADGVHGKPHFRLQKLRDALDSSDPTMPGRLRLDALFALSFADFYDSHDGGLSLRYSEARELARWLDSRRLLWPFYHAVRDNILDDPTGAAAFTRVVGKSPADATADWIAWLKSPAAEADPQ